MNLPNLFSIFPTLALTLTVLPFPIAISFDIGCRLASTTAGLNLVLLSDTNVPRGSAGSDDLQPFPIRLSLIGTPLASNNLQFP